MLPKFLIEKTTTGERTLVEGELPLRIAPPNGPGTYQVRSVSEQSTEVTVATESEPMEEPVADSGAKPAPETAPLPDPVNLVPARIEGTGVIGTALSATPGEWENATSVTGQWLRAGMPIEAPRGATTRPSRRMTERCCPTARRPTMAASRSIRRAIRCPRPIPRRPPRGDLQDEIFDLDSGPQIVETAQDFTGEGLSFEVTGAGATIDARSGRVSIPTDAAIEGEVVTVTALQLRRPRPAAPSRSRWRTSTPNRSPTRWSRLRGRRSTSHRCPRTGPNTPPPVAASSPSNICRTACRWQALRAIAFKPGWVLLLGGNDLRSSKGGRRKRSLQATRLKRNGI